MFTAPPRRILVIITRRIGDVLLATPVVRSLRCAWPDAELDVLVFRGTEGVLKGNADITRVITVPERPRLGEHLRFARRLYRRYDLAVSLLTGDRPTLYAWLAGRRRVGMVADEEKQRWKRRLLHAGVAFDNLHTHTVLMNLQTLAPLGIEPVCPPVVAWSPDDDAAVDALVDRSRPYAVLHVYPKFAYKTWSLPGWEALGRRLQGQGLQVVLTGGGAADEVAYVREVHERLPAAVNLAGRLSLAQTGALLARARLYVGPDTAVTHMAAALGTPTVALFGPSNPVKWGPWPASHREATNPWAFRGSQRRGNVYLLQGEGECVPCLLEGCDRHVGSLSECLQNMTAATVIAAAEEMLV